MVHRSRTPVLVEGSAYVIVNNNALNRVDFLGLCIPGL